MSSVPFEPRKSQVRTDLKQLKDSFDDPSHDCEELLAEFNAKYSFNEALKDYRGEILHQLALRKERRGEFERAEALYKSSMDALAGNPLAQARTLRDWGTMVSAHIDSQRGLTMVQEALRLHDHDLDNPKGRRQRRITQSYLWRAQVLAGGKNSRLAKRHLVELTGGPDFDFCIRDRKVIIDFLVPRTTESVRRELLAKQAAILLVRRKRFDAARSFAMLVIDIELSIAGSIVRRVLRKE